MYINPVLFGVFITIFAEMALCMICSLIYNIWYAYKKQQRTNYKGGYYNGKNRS